MILMFLHNDEGKERTSFFPERKYIRISLKDFSICLDRCNICIALLEMKRSCVMNFYTLETILTKENNFKSCF